MFGASFRNLLERRRTALFSGSLERQCAALRSGLLQRRLAAQFSGLLERRRTAPTDLLPGRRAGRFQCFELARLYVDRIETRKSVYRLSPGTRVEIHAGEQGSSGALGTAGSRLGVTGRLVTDGSWRAHGERRLILSVMDPDWAFSWTYPMDCEAEVRGFGEQVIVAVRRLSTQATAHGGEHGAGAR